MYVYVCVYISVIYTYVYIFFILQVQPYFFQDITDRPMFTWYRDDKRDNVRTEYLCRVITASMEFIHQEDTDNTTISSTQAISWMSKCQTLASTWKINNDELRIHQVYQLYVNGFDRLAEEVNIVMYYSDSILHTVQLFITISIYIMTFYIYL